MILTFVCYSLGLALSHTNSRLFICPAAASQNCNGAMLREYPSRRYKYLFNVSLHIFVALWWTISLAFLNFKFSPVWRDIYCISLPKVIPPPRKIPIFQVTVAKTTNRHLLPQTLVLSFCVQVAERIHASWDVRLKVSLITLLVLIGHRRYIIMKFCIYKEKVNWFVHSPI
jgi:hypothetical protein